MSNVLGLKKKQLLWIFSMSYHWNGFIFLSNLSKLDLLERSWISQSNCIGFHRQWIGKTSESDLFYTSFIFVCPYVSFILRKIEDIQGIRGKKCNLGILVRNSVFLSQMAFSLTLWCCFISRRVCFSWVFRLSL